MQYKDEICVAEGKLLIFRDSVYKDVLYYSVELACHTVTRFFSQHIFLAVFIKKFKIIQKSCNKMMMMMLQGYKVIL